MTLTSNTSYIIGVEQKRERKRVIMKRTTDEPRAKIPTTTVLFNSHTDDEIKANILNAYLNAADYYEYGKGWYLAVNKLACEIALKTSVSIPTVCAVIAALSPHAKWERNLIDAGNLCKWWRDGGEMPKVQTYSTMLLKAIDILKNGDRYWQKSHASILHGNKITSFYWNILYPQYAKYVTIDSHALEVAFNTRIISSTYQATMKDKQYARIAACYQSVAEQVGLVPCELQAIVWCWVRDKKWS